MKPFIFIGVLIIVFLVVFLFLNGEFVEAPEISVDSFEDCLSAGYPILESYPRQCRMPDGKTFIEDIGNELEKIDLIQVENPRPNQKVSSPLLVKGKARGAWFFEADFPVRLLNSEGELVATGTATAQSDWMTEEFVLFSAELEFENPETKKGILIFEKDNPSGLPEYDDELIMPVYF